MRPRRILLAGSWASLTLGVRDVIHDADNLGRICGVLTFDYKGARMPTSSDLPVEEWLVEEWVKGTIRGPGHPKARGPKFGAHIVIPTVFQDGAFSVFLGEGQRLLSGEGETAQLLAETGPDTTYRWLDADKGILLAWWDYREAAVYSGLEMYEPWWSEWMRQRPGAPFAETLSVGVRYLLATRRQLQQLMRAVEQFIGTCGGRVV